MRAALVVLASLTLASCARTRAEQQSAGGTASAAPQTVEATGRVVEVGSYPTTWLALEPIGGGAQTRLGGPGAAALRAVNGAIVWVSGSRAGDEISVAVFEVRRIGDQDVDDGIVVAAASGVELRMRNGVTRPVPLATPALRGIAGARVWISRPVAGVTPSYGVIAPKP